MTNTDWRVVLAGALAVQLAAGVAAAAAPHAVAPQRAATGSEPYNRAVDRYRHKDRIKGGVATTVAEYPWQVSLGVAWIEDGFRAHFCGGSIYAASWIVTAAHCVHGNAPGDIRVTAGTDVLGAGGMQRRVRRIVVKDSFNPANRDNDIALLQLQEPLVIGPVARPVAALTQPEEALLTSKTELSVTGWGAPGPGAEPTRRLQRVRLGLIGRTACNAARASAGAVTNNMLCAGSAGGPGDSCDGDSGGPLTMKTANGTRQVGIVSQGKDCASADSVGVYARLAIHADWIAQCVKQPEACH